MFGDRVKSLRARTKSSQEPATLPSDIAMNCWIIRRSIGQDTAESERRQSWMLEKQWDCFRNIRVDGFVRFKEQSNLRRDC